MDVFPYFSGEEDTLERIEKFTALKDSAPVNVNMDEALEMEDTLTAEVE
jgi:hypothetical protein